MIPFLMLTISSFSQIDISAGDLYADRLGEDEKVYVMPLDSGLYVYGQIEQMESDVAAELVDPDGKTLRGFNTFSNGVEPFYFETDLSGNYKIKLSGEPGAFSIQLLKTEVIAPDPKDRVSQWLSPFDRKGSPGAAIMVIEDGEVEFEGYYGMANIAHQIPMISATRNNIGSTSKQFTAFGLMLIVEEGLVSLEDDVRTYLPELPDFRDTVRIRHLLTHTSGYREFLNTILMMGQHLSTPLSAEKIIELIERQEELQNKPSSNFNYNNSGYSIVTKLVEKVSGTPFDQYMKENVFDPLDMTETQYRRHNHQIITNRSLGYSTSDRDALQEVTDLGGGMGPGGIYTTLKDMKKWIDHYEDPTLCSAKIIDRMMTSDTLLSGQATNYGLGLFIQKYRGQTYVHHNGADRAHRSFMKYFPDISSAVIVHSNAAYFPGNLSQKIVDLFFEKYFEEEEKEQNSEEKIREKDFQYDIEKFEPLVGRYELEIAPGFILRFFLEDEKPMTQATGQPALKLAPLSDSVFNIVDVPNAEITFHIGPDGSADSLTLHQMGNKKAHRIKWTPDSTTLASYVGMYYGEEISTVIEVQREGEKIQLYNFRFETPFEMDAAQKDAFGSQSNAGAYGSIKFQRNDDGDVTGFNASNGRTKNVWFQKFEVSTDDTPQE